MADPTPTCLKTERHGPHYLGLRTYCHGSDLPPYTCDRTTPHSPHGWINSDKTTGHCPGVVADWTRACAVLQEAFPPPAEQPPPRPTDGPAIVDLVVADLAQRKRIGIERYGVPLQAHNGRDALVDAYEEALDLACYLRQALAEVGYYTAPTT